MAKLSVTDIIKQINKSSKQQIAYNLSETNPTEVTEWIPTGSDWLDRVICTRKVAGIPVGKITEIAGLEASGKSYLAAHIAASAQKQDFTVIYFDSEAAIDPAFLQKAGVELTNLVYIQAQSVEFVIQNIEKLLDSPNAEKFIFIWDSLAMTPTEAEVKMEEINPGSSVSAKARILSLGFNKLINKIANTHSVLLVLNQLKQRISTNPADRQEIMLEPYFTPGGKTPTYAYSLRIWLVGRRFKSALVLDDAGERIGYEVTARIKKSRFGSEGRKCDFNITWGEKVRIQNELSYWEILLANNRLVQPEGKRTYILTFVDGTTKEGVKESAWTTLLQDQDFLNKVMETIDHDIVHAYKPGKEEIVSYRDEETGGEE